MAEGEDRAAARAQVDRLAAEFRERYRGGDWPRMAEYLERFPHLEPEIREVFPTLLVRERVGMPGAPVPAPEPAAPSTSRRIGPYDTLLLLGSGGQGDVWLAEDSRLGRRVALKVLPRDRSFSGRALERFRREAAITSRLDHPGVCTVYEAGEDGGTAWIAMRYVEGETLGQWTSSSRGDPVESADPAFARVSAEVSRSVGDVRTREGLDRMVEILEKAARALHAAHEAGLVHRDIKPANIIVTPAREPVLLDFGLAREEGDESALTLTGTLMGTPAYMSPEQLTAQRIHLDRRTDVYSLGVTLYECLTLRLPFEAPTREQLYQRILASDPEDARRHNPGIPADLEVVLEMALEKDRDRRYRTALEFAEDLRRVRAREPIHARPAGPALRLRRWSERNPATAATAASLFLALSAGLAASLHLLGEARRERDGKEIARAEADRQKRAAEEARDETARLLREARALGLASASAEAEGSDPMVALRLAVEAGRLLLLPPVVERLHGALAAARERAILPHPGPVEDLAWSPAGDRLATACGDGKVRLFDRTGRAAGVLEGHEGPVRSVAWSATGDRILTASEDGTARLYSADGRPLAILRGHGGPLVAGLPVPGGGWATASEDGTARLWTADGAESKALGPAAGPLLALSVSADGKRFATGSKDGRVRILDRDGALLGEFADHGWAATVRFSPDGSRILSAHEVAWPLGAEEPDKVVRVLDTGGKVLAVLPGLVNFVSDAAWSPDGRRIALNCKEGSVSLWTADGKREQRWDVPPQAQGTVEFSPDGAYVAACGAENALHLWTVEEGLTVAEIRGHRGPPLVARFSPDGLLLASGARDGTARLWAVQGGEAGSVSLFRPEENGRTAFSPAGDRVAAWLFAGEEVRVLGFDGRPVCAFRTPGAKVSTLAFSRDGARIVTATSDGIVRIREAASGRILREFPPHPGELLSAQWSRWEGEIGTMAGDGTLRAFDEEGTLKSTIRSGDQPGRFCAAGAPKAGLVATGNSSGEVLVFARDGTPKGTFAGGGEKGRQILRLLFTPEEDGLLAACTDGSIREFDLQGKPRVRFEGHTGMVTALAFSPDGRRLLSVSRDLTARLWERDGRLRAVLRGHRAEIGEAVFLPGGERVLTTSMDGTARFWDLDGRQVDLVRGGALALLGKFVLPGPPARLVTVHADGVLRQWCLDPAELLAVAAKGLTRPFTDEEASRYAPLLGGAR